MKNRTCFFLYLSKVWLMIPITAVVLFEYMDYLSYTLIDTRYVGKRYFHIYSSEFGFLFLALAVVLMTWSVMTRMQGSRESSFVNALPVTKKQQLCMAAAAIAVAAAGSVAVQELIAWQYCGRLALWKSWLAAGIVKISALFLLLAVLLWAFAHVVFPLVKLMGVFAGAAVVFFGLQSAGVLLQLVCGYEGNHPLVALRNLWNILTIPLAEMNPEYSTEQFFRESSIAIQSIEQSDKIVLFVGYEVLVLLVAGVLFWFACRRYQKNDFASIQTSIARATPKPAIFLSMMLVGALLGCIYSDRILSSEVQLSNGYSYQLGMEGDFVESATLADDSLELNGYTGECITTDYGGRHYLIYRISSTAKWRLERMLYPGIGLLVGVVAAEIIVQFFGCRERRRRE